MSEKTIEQKTTDTILQRAQEISIGNEVYQVSPPTTATLILASELIIKLPSIKLDEDNMITEALYIAKDCRVLGDIVAVLILGAKNLRTAKTIVKKRLFGLIRETEQIVVDNQAELADKVLNYLSPQQFNQLLNHLLKTMQVSDFFGSTTSLVEINLLRQTREVVTIPSGQ